MVKLTINGEVKEYDESVTFEGIASDYASEFQSDIAGVIFNGKLKELIHKPGTDGELKFFDMSSFSGHRSYNRTATFLFMKAADDVIGRQNITRLKAEFTIGNGCYISAEGTFTLGEELAKAIQTRMQELVDEKTPIHKSTIKIEDAIKLFDKQNMADKIKLCKYRGSSFINVYEMEQYYDYYYGHMLPNAGYIKYFEVLPYSAGFMLNLPSRTEPNELKPFVPREKLFETMRDATDWGEKLGIDAVGDLNDCICAGGLNEMILVQEALQERRIAEIAQGIVERKGVKFIMIAGPSSSGKTSFSYRLSVQLKTHGLKPHPIAVDDYFVNREDTPRDENGDYNFECLEAIDIALFNKDMSDLLAGKRVEIPTFNFKTGRREYKGNFKQLGPDDVLVIEGIHALNDRMSSSLPTESKYKIYISALTTLNVDEHNRIPTTDARMLRRMVRDARTRGASATRTIQMWPSVRRGEEENIFPYQESADAMFNSATVYELAVIKTFAEPLLYSVRPDEPEYLEAKRLLKFLSYFLCVDTANLPNNSIVREFVGGSCFNV